MAVLLVDVANVVGSRPDGWWRDRAGATSRLLAQLAPLTGGSVTTPGGQALRCDEVVAVVEGAARDVPDQDGVTLVRAPGSGDDALVAAAARIAGAGTHLVVVTADRGLRERLPAGTAVTGPGWLLAALPPRPA
ncbi:hypothetical protein GCU56_03450 [Geodermatophilus sabuli]|uniref:NTP pyrophosphohydrolase n=1 Tax=Geodermatophilus sabuli TaxID=1564158 RepID=A0A7K3VWA6_9ACTN|nr:hypothetical protein [Geodermatophilus sabuli]NEK56926.1 hypothetical protein [Geodermatophilus sabuli]